MAISFCDVHVDQTGYELVNHGSTLFPVAIYDDDVTTNPVAWHWHDEFEILRVYEGTAVVSCGSEEYIVSEGQGVFTNAGVLHSDGNYISAAHSGASALADTSQVPACRFRSIVFHPRLVGGSMDSIFWQNYLQPIISNSALQGTFLSPEVPWQNEILNAIEHAWQSMNSENTGYEFEVRSQLSNIIFLLKQHACTLPETPSGKNLREATRIKQMLQYIQAHYAEEIRTEDIANSASISVSECLRCFKNTIHTTPIQYTIEYRIQKAAELLKSTDLNITEIGTRCGFVDMSYFTRIFKRTYGCTPKKYRAIT